MNLTTRQRRGAIADIEPLAPCRALVVRQRYRCPVMLDRNDPLGVAVGADSTVHAGDVMSERDAKKIVAGVIVMSDDSLYTQFYCVGEDGRVDGAVSPTLCRAVRDLLGPELDEFLSLLDAASRGTTGQALAGRGTSRGF